MTRPRALLGYRGPYGALRIANTCVSENLSPNWEFGIEYRCCQPLSIGS